MSRSPTVSRPRRSEPAGVIFLDARKILEVIDDLPGFALADVEQEASCDSAVVLDGLQQFLLLLFAHAR